VNLKLLKLAIRSGSVETVRGLLVAGANLELSDELGMTPLHVAASTGHLDICKLLLERGANPDLVNRAGLTALTLAGQAGHGAVVRLIEQARDHTAGKPAMQPEAEETGDDDRFPHPEPDLDGWEPELYSPPPVDETEFVRSVSLEIVQVMATHVAVDDRVDWSDVIIDLPGIDVDVRLTSFGDVPFHIEIRELISTSLLAGVLDVAMVRDRLEAFLGADFVADEDAHPDEPGVFRNLLRVIRDLRVREDLRLGSVFDPDTDATPISDRHLATIDGAVDYFFCLMG